jgi:mono/diheme cytochrome c family protein
MSNGWRALGAAALIAISAFSSNGPLSAQQDANASAAAAGPGRDIFVNACSQCHALAVITHIRWGKEAWRHQVYDMVQRGAQVSPAEMDTLVNYLVANFGTGVPLPGQTPGHADLAAGPGSDLVATRCTICHSAEGVTAAKRSSAQWNAIVAKMVFFGAPLNADQVKTVVTYLASNYGTAR